MSRVLPMGSAGNSNPNSDVLVRRNIENLRKLGAPRDIVGVLARADAVGDNTPRDGFSDMDELVKSSSPLIVDLMLPAERQALARATPLFELGNLGPPKPAVELPTLQSQITVSKTDPRVWANPGIDLNYPIPFKVPNYTGVQGYDFADLFTRIQQVANNDGKTNTITLGELRQVRASHRGAFTDIELQRLDRAEEKMVGILTYAADQAARLGGQPTPGVGANVQLPAAGHGEVVLTTGPTVVAATHETQVIDQPDRFAVERGHGYEVRVPPGMKAVVIDEESDHEWFFTSDNRGLPTNSGHYIVETWQNGQRIHDERVTLPRFPEGGYEHVEFGGLEGYQRFVGGAEVDAHYPWPNVAPQIIDGTIGRSTDNVRVVMRGKGPVTVQVAGGREQAFLPRADGKLAATVMVTFPSRDYTQPNPPQPVTLVCQPDGTIVGEDADFGGKRVGS